MANTAKEIAIISVPRSGTNFFCDTLGEFTEIASLFELLNPRGVFGLERYPELLKSITATLGIDASKATDPTFIEKVAHQRHDFLAALRTAVAGIGLSAFSYKLFPEQIPYQVLENILTDRTKLFFFITRSRIDTYISYRKALELDEWVGKKTHDINIEITFDQFMEWATKIDAWYENAEKILREHDQRYSIFSYDSDINVPKPTLIEKQYFTLRSMGLDAAYPTSIAPPSFRKQDKIAGPFTKIANGEELKQIFLEKKLLGKYVLRAPLTR